MIKLVAKIKKYMYTNLQMPQTTKQSSLKKQNKTKNDLFRYEKLCILFITNPFFYYNNCIIIQLHCIQISDFNETKNPNQFVNEFN